MSNVSPSFPSLSSFPALKGLWSLLCTTARGLRWILGFLCVPLVLLLFWLRKLGGKYDNCNRWQGDEDMKASDFPYRLVDTLDDELLIAVTIFVSLVWLFAVPAILIAIFT